ncbi:hypothetical protein [Undibacterium sp. Ji22W]|uniref:hypothetical protein n=1 Tax=Undibacterium sp. Ji22W TaxID=3413038 RepID=UPI003BF42E88
MLFLQRLPTRAMCFCCVIFMLNACVAVHDPLIGNAKATLKGAEFGPSDELLADIKISEVLITENASVLRQLNEARFYQGTEKERVDGMTDEFKGDRKRAQATYAYYAQLPVNQTKLKSQLSDIIDRLKSMEVVRKKTNYTQLVKVQGQQNERLREAQMANTNSLQGALANNANFYKALGSGPDVIRYKDSRGSYSDQTTFKGMVRENTLANQKMLEAQLKNAEANVANEQRAAERSQQDFLKRNPGLEELRAYMSNESDLISEKLWPALKATLAELKSMLAAADPENTKTK